MNDKFDSELNDIRRRAGLNEMGTVGDPADLGRRNMASNFEPLDIQTSEEFGQRYSQQIHSIAADNEIGEYIGYTLTQREKLIDLIGTKAVVTINFALQPLSIKAVSR